MIDKINIENFGCYNAFKWNLRDSGRNPVVFKKLNIIYGRNYSGKTTLSRIFRTLETGRISAKIKLPKFEIKSGVTTYNETTGIVEYPLLRVYNKDYVDEHLSFLRDENGYINSFAVLGAENASLKTKIEALEEEIGSVEAKTGLRYLYDQKREEIKALRRRHAAAESALEKKLFDKANDPKIGIKYNKYYGFPNYDIRKLKADIEKVRSDRREPLESEAVDSLMSLLGDVPMSPASIRFDFKPNLASLCEQANAIFLSAIQPTVAIEELMKSPDLQNWVRVGIPLHQHNRNSCGFCGGILPEDLWFKLSNHFSRQAAQLEGKIDELQTVIKDELYRLDAIEPPRPETLYSAMKDRCLILNSALEEQRRKYKTGLEALNSQLERKRKSIFSGPIEAIKIPDDEAFRKCRVDLFALVQENNDYSKTLKSNQEAAKLNLRLNAVSKFVREIDLASEELSISAIGRELSTANHELEDIKLTGKSKDAQINALKIQMHDERLGAEHVNKYLTHLLSSNLKLDAIQTGENAVYRFQVLRDDQPAFNLSEGECSLIAFCYFMAKLKDIATNGKKPIVYIDDPISSLDSNHIFFIYSLIETELAQSVAEDGSLRYSQLFISTHNLEFLKYLKRLSKPKNQSEHFILTKRTSSTAIELMPNYLRHYITELNFLFDELHTCADPTNQALSYHSFYNFGNNLRKFLEAFLFFKYPVYEGSNDSSKRIEKFFGDDPTAQYFIERVANEYSHIGEFVDRGAEPIDCDEIARLSKFVLGRIKATDSVQYECFIKSIEKTDPLSLPT